MSRSVMLAAVLLSACGGSQSDALGVAAECTADTDCNQNSDPPLACLDDFAGGYCGLTGCTADADCPTDAICITHTDGVNYCFRTCVDKPECNTNRTVDNESNCSSNVTRVEAEQTVKVCVPPSGA